MNETIELSYLLGEHVLAGCQFGTIPKTSEWQDGEPNTIDFILDGENISAVEDPDDGYRSSMDELIKNRDGLVITNTFQPVRVLGTARANDEYCKNDVIDLIDCVTGKIVLSVGTENTDDYYPCFMGVFYPENMWINANKT